MSASQSAAPIEAKVGQPFEIRLEGTPTAGYVWQWEPEGAADLIELISSAFVAAAKGVLGGSGAQVFRFRALREGQLRLRFRYGRRWEATCVRNIDIVVSIGVTP